MSACYDALTLVIALVAVTPVIVLFNLVEDPANLFDTRNLDLLRNTLLLMGLTVLDSTLLGVPLAMLTAYVRLPWGRRG